MVAVKSKCEVKELPASRPLRKGIELRAISNNPEEVLGIVRRNPQHSDAAACGVDETGHQVHQRRFPRAVRSYKAGDPSWDVQCHSIDAEYIAIEFRNILEFNVAARCEGGCG